MYANIDNECVLVKCVINLDTTALWKSECT